MRKCIYTIALFFTFFIVVSNTLFAQKRSIDTSVLGSWPSVDNAKISNNGSYMCYNIENHPVGKNTLVIRQTSAFWQKQYTGASFCFFTEDSKQAVFKKNDTLYFLSLTSGITTSINNISSLSWPRMGKGNWIAFQSRDSGIVTLQNVVSGETRKFRSVKDFIFDNGGNYLLLNSEDLDGNERKRYLNLITLNSGKTDTIWSSEGFSADMCHINTYAFDMEGMQLGFIIDKGRDSSSVEIWYFKTGMVRAVLKVSKLKNDIENDLYIDPYYLRFSRNKKWLFFRFQKRTENIEKNTTTSNVDVWSYKDVNIQPDQMWRQKRGPQKYLAVVSLDNGNVIRLEQNNESILTGPDDITGDFAVIADNTNVSDYWWTLSPLPAVYLISLKDGSRKVLKSQVTSLGSYNFTFSPKGEFLIYYDWEREAYFSYNANNGITSNITNRITGKVRNDDIRYLEGIVHVAVAPVVGWHINGSRLLLYDNYDIWELDPRGIRMPKSVTNNFGAKNKIKLRLVNGPEELGMKPIIYEDSDTLLITAFNETNKFNGFYSKKLNQLGDPTLLTMGPFTYYRTISQKSHYYYFDNGKAPVKAKNANCWIISRQSAKEAPNYYFTVDFRKYIPLSDVEPQKSFNWLYTELVTWKSLQGKTLQGILYKPENFSSNRKYPVIINYYHKLSHRMYEFPYPELTTSNINIPWFVSNGYLVFTPDIDFEVGSTSNRPIGYWACNSVLSAVEYLSKLSYVNSKKIGIQGHSFGGLLTNYLTTHTKRFAAAAEVAGSSDPVSAYLTLVGFDGSLPWFSKQSVIERGHELYGGTPWQYPELYKNNSAILNAHEVITPLLIMHNKKDNQVQWEQGLELFMALRRLGKKVWMLQYDEGGHDVFGKDAVDYTIRLTQFFNHYLKDERPPIWMTRGIPFDLKGIEPGLKLDYSDKKP